MKLADFQNLRRFELQGDLPSDWVIGRDQFPRARISVEQSSGIAYQVCKRASLCPYPAKPAVAHQPLVYGDWQAPEP